MKKEVVCVKFQGQFKICLQEMISVSLRVCDAQSNVHVCVEMMVFNTDR